MNSIVPFVNRCGADFVGYAALMLAQSAVVILLLLGLDWALRRKVRATVRYALCLLALVKLVLPPYPWPSPPALGIGYRNQRLPSPLHRFSWRRRRKVGMDR